MVESSTALRLKLTDIGGLLPPTILTTPDFGFPDRFKYDQNLTQRHEIGGLTIHRTDYDFYDPNNDPSVALEDTIAITIEK